MTWIWLSIIVALVGAKLNAEIEHQTARESTTGQPKPLGMRGTRMAGTVGGGTGVTYRMGRMIRRCQTKGLDGSAWPRREGSVTNVTRAAHECATYTSKARWIVPQGVV
jgi:hypothetical protein